MLLTFDEARVIFVSVLYFYYSTFYVEHAGRNLSKLPRSLSATLNAALLFLHRTILRTHLKPITAVL